MDGEILVTFKYYKIMSVAFVIAEEQILAMCGVDLFPVFQCEIDGRKRRMVVGLESDAVFLEKLFCFPGLFACHDDLFEWWAKIRNFLIIFVRLSTAMPDMPEYNVRKEYHMGPA